MPIEMEDLKNALGEFKTSLKDEVQTMINTSNQGLASNILKRVDNQFEKFKTGNEGGDNSDNKGDNSQGSVGDLALKNLQTTVSDLNQKLEKTQTENLQDKRNLEISRLVTASGDNTTGKDILTRQISSLYGDKLEFEGGKWYVKDGDKVTLFSDVFDGYLKSDEGKFFVTASGAKGSDSKTTLTKQKANNVSKDSKVEKGQISGEQSEAIVNAFAGIT